MEDPRKAFFIIVAGLTLGCTLALPAIVDSVPDTSGSHHGESDDNRVRANHSYVIIIGAGPSGVAAASRLLENGVLDVTILEAEDRLGGRTHTIPFGNNDVVDLGAQWVHGVEGNVVYEMANPLGLLEENATQYFTTARCLRGNDMDLDPNLMRQLFDIWERIEKDKEGKVHHNGSYGQFFAEKFAVQTAPLGLDPSLADSIHTWLEKVSAFGDGADSWFNLSSKGSEAYWECRGDQGINWINNGYYSLINLLTKRYPDPAQELPVRNKTHLVTEAKTIHWGPRKVVGPSGRKVVLIETSDGARYTSDIVLVTVSVGVLKEKAATLFDPPLPERKLNAIQHSGFGQVNKIFLHFNETWWPDNVTGFSVISTAEDRLRFHRLYPQYKEKGEWINGLTGFYGLPRQPRHVLFDWIVGEPARNMEKYSDEEVMLGCMRWLEMYLNQTLPSPTSFARSKWYSNPHFRGSYSHRSLDSEKYDAQPAHLAEPLQGQDGTPEVLFAGEATSDHHFSTVHGAVETGWREADRILDLLGKENCPSKPTSTP